MNPFLIQCAWCRRVKVGDDYVSASPVPWAAVSHGICPDCFAKQFPKPIETPFAALAIGDRFRILTPKGPLLGHYVKTGADSYGYRPGDPLWPVQDDQFPTVPEDTNLATPLRAHAA